MFRKSSLMAIAAMSCLMATAGPEGSDNGGSGPGPNPPPTPPVADRAVKARVLSDCVHGKCGDVVSLPASVAKSAAEQGLVDTHRDAVAYAEREAQKKRAALEE